MFQRNNVATLVAEALGTALLTLVILSVQRSTIGVPFFVAIAAGLAVVVLVVALGRVTGAHFNPAVTLALWTIRKVRTVRALALIGAQLLGAWGAFFLYRYMVNQTLQPVGGDYSSRILVAEAVGGIVLGFAWATASYHVMSVHAKAALVSAAYVLAIIIASAASIGLINPAVALGVRAWEWGTYVLGPVLGAIIGVNLYGLLFAPAVVVAPARVQKVTPVVSKSTTKTVAAKKTAKTSTKKRSTKK
jgi:glycerol uptake facilitator-like aquaporin